MRKENIKTKEKGLQSSGENSIGHFPKTTQDLHYHQLQPKNGL